MRRFKLEPMSVLLIGIAIFIVYALIKRGTLDRIDAIYLAVLVPSVILHEVAHGALAYVYGDDTAKRAGRLTLNPVRHVDPIGTLLLPGLLILSGAPAFGYAKPVPVNTSRMSRNQDMMTALIGPITNIVLSMVAAGFLIAVSNVAAATGTLSDQTLLFQVLLIFGIVNVTLAVFNLIPIPPLDGSAVVERFLPARYLPGYHRFRQYSMFILLALVLVGGNVLGAIFDPAIELWLKLVGWG